MKNTEELKITVAVDKNIQISTSAIIFALFGMPIEELTREMRDNKEGQYEGIVKSNEIAI